MVSNLDVESVNTYGDAIESAWSMHESALEQLYRQIRYINRRLNWPNVRPATMMRRTEGMPTRSTYELLVSMKLRSILGEPSSEKDSVMSLWRTSADISACLGLHFGRFHKPDGNDRHWRSAFTSEIAYPCAAEPTMIFITSKASGMSREWVVAASTPRVGRTKAVTWGWAEIVYKAIREQAFGTISVSEIKHANESLRKLEMALIPKFPADRLSARREARFVEESCGC